MRMTVNGVAVARTTASTISPSSRYCISADLLVSLARFLRLGVGRPWEPVGRPRVSIQPVHAW